MINRMRNIQIEPVIPVVYILGNTIVYLVKKAEMSILRDIIFVLPLFALVKSIFNVADDFGFLFYALTVVGLSVLILRLK